MTRDEFRQKMDLFKQAKGENPLLSYWEWKNTLPDNLANTPDWQYDNIGAWSGGLTPEMNEDGYYHLGSRNPNTGEILKPKSHPTYQKAIENDIAAGYYPYEKNGRTYTKTYAPTGDLSGYADGTDYVKEVASYLPVVGTAMDFYELYKNPSLENAGWATLSLGSDILCGGFVKGAAKAAKLAKATKNEYKLAKNSAEAALDFAKKKNIQLQKLNNPRKLEKSNQLIQELSWQDMATGFLLRQSAKDARNSAIKYNVLNYGVNHPANASVNYLQNKVKAGQSQAYTDGTDYVQPLYYGAYNPKQQAYELPVYKEHGVVLPEVLITPKDNTDISDYRNSSTVIPEVARFTPGVGDTMDIIDIGKDVRAGNYGLAALGAGLFFLPDVVAKPLMKGFRKAKKWYNVEKRLSDAVYDLPNYEKRVREAVESGIKSRYRSNKSAVNNLLANISKHSGDLKNTNRNLPPRLLRNFSEPDFRAIKTDDVRRFVNKHNLFLPDFVTLDNTSNGVVASVSDYDFPVSNFVNTGEYRFPLFGTNETASGKIDLQPGGSTNMYNFADLSITTSVNERTKINVPEEYPKQLQRNIDYVKKQFPGFKEFGSSEGAAHSGFPHNTHDIDGFIIDKDFDKIEGYNKKPIRKSDDGLVNTYTINLDNGVDEAKNIDMNIIYTNKDTGKATGENARELFKQFFPDEYQKAIKKEYETGKFEINKTPEELMEAYDPSVKTIMDSFEIDFRAPGKQKHAGRPLVYLSYGNPDKVSKGLHLYAKEFVGEGVQLPKANPSEFNDVEKNIKLLDDWNIGGDKYAIASDPKKMQNALDYWVINNSVFSRAVNLRFLPEKDMLETAMTTWNPKSVGGNAHGAGLNTVSFGNSRHDGYYAQLQPKLDIASDRVSDIVEAVKKSSGHYSRPLTQNEKDIALELLSKYKFGNGDIETTERLLDIIPPHGSDADSFLKEFSERTNINAITRDYIYGDSRYASVIRNIDPNTDAMHYIKPNDTRPISSTIRNLYTASNKNANVVDAMLIRDKMDLQRNSKHMIKRENMKEFLDFMLDKKLNKIEETKNIETATLSKNINSRKERLHDLNSRREKIKNRIVNRLKTSMMLTAGAGAIYGGKKLHDNIQKDRNKFYNELKELGVYKDLKDFGINDDDLDERDLYAILLSKRKGELKTKEDYIKKILKLKK